MRASKYLRAGALTAVLALALTACGGDDGGAAIASLEDTSGQTIGVQSATTGEMYANENAPDDAEIQAFENPGDLLTALQSGQVDAVLQDLPVNAEFARNNEGFEIVEEYDTGEQYGFAVAEEGSDELLSAINDALSQLRDGDTYQTIFDKYFATEDAPTEIPSQEPMDGVDASNFGLITDGTLTVCSDIPYAPFEFEEDGEFTGFDIDLMRAIAQKLGLELEVKAIGFDPIQSGTALNSDQCDVAASAMTITEEREENLNFSEPYYDAKQSLLAPTSE
ncbi:MAG: transporter substrate-binding domain-containing protein [Nitriliruptorales bacterium]|nr:transporter substrate-binding domain-containing protein [Nitriliruptorales bacterium]